MKVVRVGFPGRSSAVDRENGYNVGERPPDAYLLERFMRLSDYESLKPHYRKLFRGEDLVRPDVGEHLLWALRAAWSGSDQLRNEARFYDIMRWNGFK